jgi:hypothetical protein
MASPIRDTHFPMGQALSPLPTWMTCLARSGLLNTPQSPGMQSVRRACLLANASLESSIPISYHKSSGPPHQLATSTIRAPSKSLASSSASPQPPPLQCPPPLRPPSPFPTPPRTPALSGGPRNHPRRWRRRPRRPLRRRPASRS